LTIYSIPSLGNKQIYAGLKGKGMAINEAEYINQYQGVFVIAALAVQPDFVQRYKAGHFTHKILGASHAVFYINRSTNDIERSNEPVAQRLKPLGLMMTLPES